MKVATFARTLRKFATLCCKFEEEYGKRAWTLLASFSFAHFRVASFLLVLARHGACARKKKSDQRFGGDAGVQRNTALLTAKAPEYSAADL